MSRSVRLLSRNVASSGVASRGDQGRRLLTLAAMWFGLICAGVAVGSQLPGATLADSEISHWFERERTMGWNKTTAILGGMASTKVVIGITVGVIAISLLRRRMVGVALLVIAMVGEVTIFLTITLVVDRPRPSVVHLDGAPPTSSFPSGHTMATFVLWNTLFVVAVRQDWPRLLRHVMRFLAFAMPILVGTSRVYRGMHHPTDVLASFVLGTLWMLAVIRFVGPGLTIDRWFSRRDGGQSIGRRTFPARDQSNNREYSS